MGNSAYILSFLALVLVGQSYGLENVLCKGRGYRDSEGACICNGRYYGANCEYVHCPFGPSWLATPQENNKRNDQLAECSDMGHCDMWTGQCECREGYEGAACERIGCPTSVSTASYTTMPDGLYVNYDPPQPGDGRGKGFVDANGRILGVPSSVRWPVCSGHGVCRTLREAGIYFDGLSLQRPTVRYNLWDADRISGCICDAGYSGVACEHRVCPHGLDPTDPANVFAQAETYELHCRADKGYFALQLLGRVSEAIPWDADAATLRQLLRRSLHLSDDNPRFGNNDNDNTARFGPYEVGDVTVEMETHNTTQFATVCRQDAVAVTRVRLSQRPGTLPPMKLLRHTSDSRRWPYGSQALTLHGSEANVFLRLGSRQVLTCPACSASELRFCDQTLLHLSYMRELTPAINVSSPDSTQQLKIAVLSLVTLQRAGYSGLTVNVTQRTIHSGTGVVTQHTSGPLCREAENTETTVMLFSDYGNIQPPLELIVADTLPDALRFSNTQRPQTQLNISLSHQIGNGTRLECSGQGICDHNSGLCKCLQQFDLLGERYDFNVMHSNGFRDTERYGRGLTGDCGYVAAPVASCSAAVSPLRRLSDNLPCSGHGVCINATVSSSSLGVSPLYLLSLRHNTAGVTEESVVRCECERGFTGLDCSLRRCPVGVSFFDEPLLNDTAHRRTQECSGNGDCDRRLGVCKCRSGFSGPNCERKNCVETHCNGRGRCLSMRNIFALHGLDYGNVSLGHANSGDSDFNFINDALPLASAAAESRYASFSSSAPAVISHLKDVFWAEYADAARASIVGGAWDADLWHECVCAASLPFNYNGKYSASVNYERSSNFNGRSLISDPYQFVTGPRREISGYSYGSKPLPGFTGYDCSQRRCPTGDSQSDQNHPVTQLEVQHVRCRWDTNLYQGDVTAEGGYFTLRLRPGETATAPISVTATSAEIATALSELPSVGNVSVAFFDLQQNSSDTSQYRACSSAFNDSYGGFLIRFETEAGPMPLLQVVESEVFGRNITVERLQSGSSSNEECSGPQRGFCNRRLGRCICNRGFSSSDGAGNRPGNRGDCSYFSGLGEDFDARDDPFRHFYRSVNDDSGVSSHEQVQSRRNRGVRDMET